MNKKANEQAQTKLDTYFLAQAATAIYRATYAEDPGTFYEIDLLTGSRTDHKNRTDAERAAAAVESINSMLADEAWLAHTAPLQAAFTAILEHARTRIEETDWTPATTDSKSAKKRQTKRSN